MEAFFLDSSNRDFAEGKGPYQPRDLKHSASVAGKISKYLMLGGVLATLGAGLLYLYLDDQHQQLLGSVKSLTAAVSGCEGPGRYQHIRFRYTVDGKVYDQSAYDQFRGLMGGSTMIDACETMKVELNYLPSDPNRWSAAPISPFSRDELEAKPNSALFVAGPMLFAFGLIAAFVAFLTRKQIARQDALKAGGVAIPAELLRIEEDTDDESPFTLMCYYQFRNPAGVLTKGNTGAHRKDLKKRDYPPPGTPVFVIYVSDKLFQML